MLQCTFCFLNVNNLNNFDCIEWYERALNCLLQIGILRIGIPKHHLNKFYIK